MTRLFAAPIITKQIANDCCAVGEKPWDCVPGLFFHFLEIQETCDHDLRCYCFVTEEEIAPCSAKVRRYFAAYLPERIYEFATENFMEVNSYDVSIYDIER